MMLRFVTEKGLQNKRLLCYVPDMNVCQQSEIRSKESTEVPSAALRLGRLAARLMADAADHDSRSSSLEDEEDGSSVLVALPGTLSH